MKKRIRCIDCGDIIKTVDGVVESRAISEFDDRGMEINIFYICDECYENREKREEWMSG